MGQKREDDGRLHLRIDPRLKRRIREYARRQGTDLSKIVTQRFLELLRQDEQQRDAEQL